VAHDPEFHKGGFNAQRRHLIDEVRRHLPVIGEGGLAASRTQDDSAATVTENKNPRGPYFAAVSLHIPDMPSFIGMREIVKIRTRSPTVYIEPVFRYRTPKSERPLDVLVFLVQIHQSVCFCHQVFDIGMT
jgi:hypothetical protein